MIELREAGPEKVRPGNALKALRSQNQDLVQALEHLQARQEDLLRVNAELEETNRGVLALHAELSEELEQTNRGVVALYTRSWTSARPGSGRPVKARHGSRWVERQPRAADTPHHSCTEDCPPPR